VEEQQKLHALKVAELQTAIQAGITSGPGIPAEEVFERMEKKYAVMAKSTNG
jgi:antitoxin ParD1/3/4